MNMLIRPVVSILLIGSLLACGAEPHENDGSEVKSAQDQAAVFKMPRILPDKVIPFSMDTGNEIKAALYVDGVEHSMSVSHDSASLMIPEIAVGSYLFEIVWIIQSGTYGAVPLIKANRSVDVIAGSNSLVFLDVDYGGLIDSNENGLSNLDELISGINPFASSSSVSSLEMVSIPAGSFLMGAVGWSGVEAPIHYVTVQAFKISRYEITFAEYDEFAQSTSRSMPGDEGFGRGNQPVINVSWQDAQAYARWLSVQTNRSYRLPTEAEWEYAARAGTLTDYHFGDDRSDLCTYANHSDASDSGCQDGYDGPAPIGQFLPNPFGLFDVHGNVWEWVEDCWNESYQGAPQNSDAWLTGDCDRRVVRGGSWVSDAASLRSAYRSSISSSARGKSFGFRLVLDD
jgi:formylglycine-generating enzyme required for sulfatase activity